MDINFAKYNVSGSDGKLKGYIKCHFLSHTTMNNTYVNDFVCVKVLRPSQPSGVMSSAVSLPNHTCTGQA